MTSIRLSSLLSKKQQICWQALKDPTVSEVLFGGGAGGGKSYLGCVWILVNLLKYPETRWLIGRSKLKNLRQTTFVTFLQVCKDFGLRVNLDFKVNYMESEINFFESGSKVILKDLFLYPSDPEFDSLGSLEITGAFIDECNQVDKKAKDIVKSRIRYKLDEYKINTKILLTCNPYKNWVYKEYYLKQKDGNLGKDKRFIKSLLTDNPFISKQYEKNLSDLPESSKQRLLYGNWEYDDDESCLMGFEEIKGLFYNDFVNGGKHYITCDVARFGKDKTVIMVWEGLRCKSIYTHEKKSITETADIINELRIKEQVPIHQIIVDEDGLGGGLVDILKCKGFIGNARPIINGGQNNYTNLRSQCYFMLSDLVNESKIYCKDQKYMTNFIKELEQIKMKEFDPEGKYSIISKDEIKKNIGHSPDYADCLMMRMFFELEPKLTIKV